jgi:hypothetical protein
MNMKRWLLAAVAVVVAVAALEMIIHGVLLRDAYVQTATLWRSEAEMQAHMWTFWLGYLVVGAVFALIYAKGYEGGKSGIGQGLRYGAYMGLLVGVGLTAGWYAVLPIPGSLVVGWMIAGFVEMLVAGIVVGLIYKQ